MKPSSSRPTAGNDLALILARGGQPGITLVQTKLRLPGNLLDRFRHIFAPLAQAWADGRFEPVAPRAASMAMRLKCALPVLVMPRVAAVGRGVLPGTTPL